MVATISIHPEEQKELKKFKLLESRHVEALVSLADWEKMGRNRLDPARLRTYHKGEIVESTRDLDRIFENKFRKVSEEEQQAPVDLEARKVEVDQLINGGTWAEEDRKFLTHLSDENFKRLNNRFLKAMTNKPSEDKGVSILGEDVTSQFQVAYDEGYKVWKNAQGKFQFTTKIEPNKPLNRDPLAKPTEVDPAVTKFIKSLKE